MVDVWLLLFVFTAGLLIGFAVGVSIYAVHLDKPEVQNNIQVEDKRRFRFKFRK